MNLYLLRHASAGLRRTNPTLDAKRSLDKEGKQQCMQLAAVLSTLKLQFDLVVSSPLKRSLQSAALVGTETGYEAKILVSPALAPNGTFADFQKLIAQCAKLDNVLFVGHNPNLTSFLGKLIVGETKAVEKNTLASGIVSENGHHAAGAAASRPGAGRAAGASATIRLRKGSLARVNCESHPPSLQWLLEPRVVRALYANSVKSSRRKTSRK